MNVAVIIPSLNPDNKLIAVVEGMIAEGFDDIIVVDDGSDEAHKKYFEEVAKHKECTMLVHEVNKGKGRALKTAFTYVYENRKDCIGVITVDGDNQHKPKDVMNCAKELEKNPDSMILGVRNFNEKHVPFRSRFGNKMTSTVFKFACGLDICDTQTGLRAIAYKHLPVMNEVTGDRFEYETNMLLELKKSDINYIQVPIETVYIDDNDSSHFNPIKDSFKIYMIIFKYIFGSVASCVIDLVCFAILNAVLGFMADNIRMLVATAAARVISSLFNYTYNRKAVFKSKDSVKSSMVRYYILCVCQMMVSYGLVYGITRLFPAGNVLTVVFKAIIDTVLFFISFKIQRAWVFKK